MIRKLENGNTLITLGKGTVFTGNVYVENSDKPFGIYFTNEQGKTDNAVILHLSGKSGVASYVMALVKFLEPYVDKNKKEIYEMLHQLEQTLEPHLPNRKEESY